MNRARGEVTNGVASPGLAVDCVLVVGMDGSGVGLLGEALSLLGLGAIDGHSAAGGRTSALSALNEKMVRVVADSQGLPVAAPLELARTLAPWADEAIQTLKGSISQPGSELGTGPWVWADPRLSFLGRFWVNALAVRPALVLIHRDPAQVVAELAVGESDEAAAATAWDRYNRSALLLSSEFPTLVISHAEACSDPKVILATLTEFLEGLGVTLEEEQGPALELMEAGFGDSEPGPLFEGTLDRDFVTLGRVLEQLSQPRNALHDVDRDDRSLIAATSAFYEKDYYGASYDKSGVPYGRDERVWVDFMSGVGQAIVDTLRPRSVLDVGCAIGLLVEALRQRGVDARGIDISSWAIAQVPADLKPYCRLGSITDEIQGRYDLITCVETLEHIPPSLAEASVANLCRHTDQVLFSSTPDDHDEPTHLNVEPSPYWAKLFLRQGFVRDLDYDATYLSAHAALFRRKETDAEALVESYEEALSDTIRLREHRDAVLAELATVRESVQNLELRYAAASVASFDAVRQLEAEQRRMAGMLTVREWELEALRNTKTFRYTARLRSFYGRLRRRPPAPLGTMSPPNLPDGTYEHWIELYDSLDEPARRHLQSRVHALEHCPKISVLMPVYNPPLDMLRAAIESVQGQIYPAWELCIADDCSTDAQVPDLLAMLAAADPRIKVLRREENGHIAAASNSALSLVTGQWIAPLDHDDVLAEHALAMFALAISDNPDAGIVYSDEDKLDENGSRRDPYFKPDFDPLLLLGQNFLSHFSAFRKDLVDRVGGYRVGYEGSQDWDLTLRVSELLERGQVVHVPHVLYHWRVHDTSTASLVSAKPYAVEAGHRAVLDHLERTGRDTARVERIGLSGFNRVVWSLPEPAPKVTIIVPTRDGRLLARCIDSVLGLTRYPEFEVVVVDNSSRAHSTLKYLHDNEYRLSIIRYEHPFSHSAMNNFAVARTSSEVVCLLNDDTEVITGNWLSEMVSHLGQARVGAVGAKLFYGDGRIQHAGVILGVHGVAGHAHRNSDRLFPGYYGQLQLAHRMSAVSAACMVLRRESWDRVGGFDEQSLPNVLNDVDLCLRLRDAGWDIVWTPYAELFHHESTSRGLDNEGPQAEAYVRAATYMKSRWGMERLRQDPHYNPNLSLDDENFSLAWPPRAHPTQT